MSVKDFRKTRELFEAALERPPEQRDTFLRQVCGSDGELYQRLGRLLRHAESEAEPEGLTQLAQAPEAPPSGSAVGTIAADFDLACTSTSGGRGRARLAEYRGRWLVLVFYPRDFSLVCPTELRGLSARIDEFRAVGAEILAVSVDTLDNHERWLRTPRALGGLGGLAFPLASDPGGTVSRAYGVYLEAQHVSLRGLYIIDPNGVLQYHAVHNLIVGRRTDEVLRVLSALQTGGLCAEDWRPGLDTMDPAATLAPGSMVSHYRIEKRVGSGSFGAVFRARDITLERTVALKVIRGETPIATTAALAEARAAAALNHPNICTVFAVEDDEGIPFIAMEYVEGRPLDEVIDQGPPRRDRAADIAAQIAEGMAAAHAAGITHGDLKPANIVIRNDGVAKILDFGLARLREPKGEASRATVVGLRGTPAYMAPEQTAGAKATPGSDVFSLGVMLYELLTGRSPFEGETIEGILTQVQAVDGERLTAELDEPFSTLVRRALARDPAQRDITMQELARTLGSAGPCEDASS